MSSKLFFYFNIVLISLAFGVLIALAWNSPNNNPPSSTNQALYISPTSNVGIGTTAPASPLHILGNVNREVARFQGSTDVSNNRNFISLYTTNPGYWWEFSSQDSSGGGTLNGLAFRENSAGLNNVRMYLASGGNVGIGTVTPGQNLTLEGTAPIAEIRSGGYLMLRPTANNWDMRLQAVGTRLDVLSGGSLSSPIASFLNGGNVGIGTTAPTNPLTVAGNANITGTLTVGSCVGCGGGGGITGSGSANTLPIFTGAGSIGNSLLSDNGSVYTLSTRALSVPNNYIYSGSYIQAAGSVYGYPVYSNGYAVCQSNGTNCPPSSGVTGSGNTYYIPKWSGSTSLMNSIIYDNGSSVGIGTTIPSQKLEVAGNIKAGRFYVGDQQYGTYAPGIGTDGTNVAVVTNGVLGVVYPSFAYANVYANDYYITSIGKWASQAGNFGGMYSIGSNYASCNAKTNPYTGGYSCPSGFNDAITADFEPVNSGCNWMQIHYCYK